MKKICFISSTIFTNKPKKNKMFLSVFSVYSKKDEKFKNFK